MTKTKISEIFFSITIVLLLVTMSSTVSAATMEERTIGETNAPIVIELFTDFQGPFDARWYTQTYPAVLENYIDVGEAQVIVKYFPLPMYPNSYASSLAVECAAEQGEVAEYIDIVYQNQDALSEEDLFEYAEELDLDMDLFDGCFSSFDTVQSVEDSISEANARGVNGVPYFFINNEPLVGSHPYATFENMLENAEPVEYLPPTDIEEAEELQEAQEETAEETQEESENAETSNNEMAEIMERLNQVEEQVEENNSLLQRIMNLLNNLFF